MLGLWTALLPKLREECSEDATSCTRGKEPEMPDGVPVTVRDVIGKVVDELLGGVAGYDFSLQLVVEGQKANLLGGGRKNPILGQGRSTDSMSSWLWSGSPP